MVRYHDWEDIEEAGGHYTQRTRVPGGWLYRTYYEHDLRVLALAMCFVPYAAWDEEDKEPEGPDEPDEEPEE